MQCEGLDEATGEMDYVMMWQQKSELTELKARDASCTKGKKMGMK